MKKIFFVLLVTAVSVLCSCSKDESGLLYLEPCGMQLPIEQSYLDKGLSVESYGTDIAIYPVAIIGFSYPDAIQQLYSEAAGALQNLETQEQQDEFYADLQKRMEVHQKLIGEIAVIPTKEYKDILKNPLEGYEFITDMKVIAKRHGNTYLFSKMENTTDGMSEEEEQVFLECQDHALNAIKKARYKKISIEGHGVAGNEFSSDGEYVKFPMFASVDLDGNSCTELIFKEKEMTVLVLWNHENESCADFAKKISRWSENLPDNVQAVGLVCDINSPADTEKIEKAKSIVSPDFKNIIAGGDLGLLNESFKNLPTVFFVDSDGDVWGMPLENPDIGECAQMLSMWENAQASINAIGN